MRNQIKSTETGYNAIEFVYPEPEPGEKNFEIEGFHKYPYTRSQLDRAFSQIENKDDWKAPISQFVVISHPADLGLIASSIVFFTATFPTLTNTNGEGGYLVEAKGYRAGPAGDH